VDDAKRIELEERAIRARMMELGWRLAADPDFTWVEGMLSVDRDRKEARVIEAGLFPAPYIVMQRNRSTKPKAILVGRPHVHVVPALWDGPTRGAILDLLRAAHAYHGTTNVWAKQMPPRWTPRWKVWRDKYDGMMDDCLSEADTEGEALGKGLLYVLETVRELKALHERELLREVLGV